MNKVKCGSNMVRIILKEIWEWVIVFAAAFFMVLLLNTLVFATTQVRQTSMQDTLFEGQHLFVEKISYLFRDPVRGEIVVFTEDEYPSGYIEKVKIFIKDISEIFKPIEKKTNIRLVKRIVGMPGDELDLREGKVYINGEYFDEPYAKGKTFRRELNFPIMVPPDEYLVLGDNREVSKDSRTFGFIKRSQIESRAIFRFWPLKSAGAVQ